MDEIQIRKYEKLSELKNMYKTFIEQEGDVAIVRYSVFLHNPIYYTIEDDEFKERVKNIAKERLENINKQIKEL